MKISVTLTGTLSLLIFKVKLKNISNKCIIIFVLSIRPASLYLPINSYLRLQILLFLTKFPCFQFVHPFSTLNLEWLSTINKKKKPKLLTMALNNPSQFGPQPNSFSRLISPTYHPRLQPLWASCCSPKVIVKPFQTSCLYIRLILPTKLPTF